MRIGPFNVGRSARAEDQPAARPPLEAKGASGTINFRGFLQSDEYKRELVGLQGLLVFDQMLRSDGSVQEAVEHIFAPIRNADVTVEPPEAPDADELVATALVRDAFFETLSQPFLEYVDQALDYLTFGHQVFEQSWQVVERELRYEIPGEYDVDPDTGKRVPKVETAPSQQWLVWDRFEQRMQKTLYRWHVERGKLTGITQSVYNSDTGDYAFPFLDAQDLLVLTSKRRGDDFTGRSLLRAAYKPWFLKELIEKVEAVSLERWGVGIAVGYVPQSRQDDAAAIGRLEDILANLKAGESTYVVMPGPKQGAGVALGEGYLIEIIGPTGTPPDFKSAKEFHRSEIKAAVLARFAELGHAQTGARATGDTQSKVWYDALHAVARYLSDVHQPAIDRLVKLNLPGVTRYPTLTFSGLEARNLQEFAQAQAQLVASGAINADSTYRGWVREQVDGPPEDEVDDTEPADPNADPNAAPPKKRGGKQPNPDQTQLPVEAE
jgi:hypothetical protein